MISTNADKKTNDEWVELIHSFCDRVKVIFQNAKHELETDLAQVLEDDTSGC